MNYCWLLKLRLCLGIGPSRRQARSLLWKFHMSDPCRGRLLPGQAKTSRSHIQVPTHLQKSWSSFRMYMMSSLKSSLFASWHIEHIISWRIMNIWALRSLCVVTTSAACASVAMVLVTSCTNTVPIQLKNDRWRHARLQMCYANGTNKDDAQAFAEDVPQFFLIPQITVLRNAKSLHRCCQTSYTMHTMHMTHTMHTRQNSKAALSLLVMCSSVLIKWFAPIVTRHKRQRHTWSQEANYYKSMHAFFFLESTLSHENSQVHQ